MNTSSKIRSVGDFEHKLNNLFVNKRSEMKEMLEIIQAYKVPTKPPVVLQKSFILLGYGHLEGFVKEASDYIISYITFSKISANELSTAVQARIFSNELKSLAEAKKIQNKVDLILSLQEKIKKRAQIDYKAFVDTKFNLTWEIVEDIAFIFSLDVSKFSKKRLFIENVLLKYRNPISHKGVPDRGDTIDLVLTVDYLSNCLLLIEDFRDEILDCAKKKRFKIK